jgi:branched-chain amino acid transport system ATP-binding protein
VTGVLEARGLRANYGAVQVLHGVDFDVDQGEIVVILGANGAGKTTTLRAICGMVNTHGTIRLHGEDIARTSTASIVRKGVAHVPQGRGTFPELTVEENLEAGAFVRDDDLSADIDKWCEVFPVLDQRRRQLAGSLSGGEQQMLAVARALMSRPRLLLLDEPSLGLAPLIIEDLFARLAEINRDEGMTMLIVEQNANLALGVADRGFVLEAGHTVLAGTADELADDEAVRRAYLGN